MPDGRRHEREPAPPPPRTQGRVVEFTGSLLIRRSQVIDAKPSLSRQAPKRRPVRLLFLPGVTPHSPAGDEVCFTHYITFAFHLHPPCSVLPMKAATAVNWIMVATLGSLSTTAALATAVEQRSVLPPDFCSYGRFPEPAVLGPQGIQALYIFATQNAPKADLTQFMSKVEKSGLELQFVTLNIDGFDSLMVLGATGIRAPTAIRREFLISCTLRVGRHIYLSRVMHNDEKREAGMYKGGTALAAALSATVSGSPAISSPPPPTIIASGTQTKPAPVVFDVVVTAGAEKLWSGSLRVSAFGGGGATYEEKLDQSFEPCGEDTERAMRLGTSSRRLNIRLNQRGGREMQNQFSVAASWQRPYSACEGGGTATLQFDRQVTIEPGETRELAGDGGLAVKLRRRP